MLTFDSKQNKIKVELLNESMPVTEIQNALNLMKPKTILVKTEKSNLL